MKEINFNEFEQAFKTGMNVFSFGAPWCKDCKFVKPILDELSNIHKDINFYGIDVDKEEGIRDKMGIRHIPTILFVKDGKEIYDRIVEPQNKNEIETAINLLKTKF